MLDKSTDKNFLALAEQFQNKFILKDEFIDELQHDINEQEMSLNNTAKKGGRCPAYITGKIQKRIAG